MAGEESYIGDLRDRKEAAINADSDPGLIGGVRRWVALIQADRTFDRMSEGQKRRLLESVETRSGPDLPGTYYLGYEHTALKQMVEVDMDPGQVNEIGAAWNSLGNQLTEFQAEVDAAVGRSREDWTGAAGDAARSFFGGVGAWMGGTGQAFQLAGNRLNVQSEAAATARAAMPEPVDFTMDDAIGMLAAETNPFNLRATIDQINQRFAEKQQAHEQAAEVMGAFATMMADSGSAMPSFAPVPAMPSVGGGDSGGDDSGDGAGSVNDPGPKADGGGAVVDGEAVDGEAVDDRSEAGSRPTGDGSTPAQDFRPAPGPTTPQAGTGTVPSGHPGAGPLPSAAMPVTPGSPPRRRPGPGGEPRPNPSGSGTGAKRPGSALNTGPRGPGGGTGFGGGGPEAGARGPGNLGGGTGLGSGGRVFGGDPAAGRLGGPGEPGAGRAGGPGGPGGPGEHAGRAGGPGGVLGEPTGRGVGSEHGVGRGGIAGERGPVGRAGYSGAMGPMGLGGRGQGEEDYEHQRASFLEEPDPEALFGTDEATAPPVLGVE